MPDLIYNQLYFLADLSPPEDIELAHKSREMFIDARVRKGVTLSTIEFAEKIGAKLSKVENELGKFDLIVEEAKGRYLAGDHASTAELLGMVLDAFPGIEAEITRLKNQAMIWIYFTEWVMIVSTGIFCGTVVWTLMVKRRLYREIETTRLGVR